MYSLSLLEFLSLGDGLPVDWRALTRVLPDAEPLLFRWVEFALVPPRELACQFLVPLEWRETRQELVVVPWPGNTAAPYRACDRLVIPKLLLPCYRLYRAVPGQHVPEPLQLDHPNVHGEILREMAE